MIDFLLFVVITALVAGWVALHKHFQDLEERISLLNSVAARQPQVLELTDRVTRLERSVAELRKPDPPIIVERTAPPVEATETVVLPLIIRSRSPKRSSRRRPRKFRSSPPSHGDRRHPSRRRRLNPPLHLRATACARCSATTNGKRWSAAAC